MVNKPKQKGTAAESAVVSFLRTQGFPYAERLALQGGKDRGDITGVPGIVFEVKAVQEYAFNQWLGEARVERDNAGADFGMVIAKPRLVGTSKTGQWYALMYSFDYLALRVPGRQDRQDGHPHLEAGHVGELHLHRDRPGSQARPGPRRRSWHKLLVRPNHPERGEGP